MPWTAIAITLAVVLGSAFAREPIRDAVTGAGVPEVLFTRPLGYVFLAPLSDVLDSLTLLSKLQHIALVISLLLLVVLWRTWRAWRGCTFGRHARALGGVLVAILLTYAAMAVLPRPMASITSDNADILIVDFHSHTSASHDGRPGWTAERNRAWHRDGGYDVAFITDHASTTAAEQGIAGNPRVSNDGVVVLQGIEVGYKGEHVNILGAGRTYGGLLTNNGRDLDEQAVRLASLIAKREPVVVWNHPRHLGALPFASGDRTPGIRAIEVSNGAPDAMDQMRREHAAIVALAQQRHLTLVSGTDNHGWGRTAPNWTLLIIFGWRGLTPDKLYTQIETLVRQGGPDSTRVIERRMVEGTKPVSLAATVVTVPAMMLATMSADERVAWLVWTWLFTIGAWWLRRRRA